MHRRVVLAAVITLLALTGCTAEPVPRPTDSMTSSPSPSQSQTTSMSPDALPGPICQRLLNIGWVQQHLDAGATGPQNPAFDEDQLATESAQEAYRQSELLRTCRWEIAWPGDPIDVAVLAIDPDVEETLRAALADSPGVTDSSSGDIAAFTQQWEHGATFSHAYAFADGYWVVVNGPAIVEPGKAAYVAKTVAGNVADAVG